MNNEYSLLGSKDGDGADDKDKPYKYFKPTVEQPSPFNTKQYSRLLVLRTDVRNSRLINLDTPPRIS
jgi:hypothetical protein